MDRRPISEVFAEIRAEYGPAFDEYFRESFPAPSESAKYAMELADVLIALVRPYGGTGIEDQRQRFAALIQSSFEAWAREYKDRAERAEIAQVETASRQSASEPIGSSGKAMQPNNSGLLPCPFCGDINASVNDVEFCAEVQCGGNNCNARVSSLHEREAIEKWNIRAFIAARPQAAEPQAEASGELAKRLAAIAFQANMHTPEGFDEMTRDMESACASRSAPTDEKALIDHCASLAVAYMQDQPSWDGTAADCGYLRDAIVNGDHSGILAHEAPKDGR